MNLKTKSDDLLVAELKTLVRRERETTAEILHYFREVSSRRTYLERGHSSLFDFATRELGYSAGGAHRRIQSMRLLQTMPELEDKVASGELSLCVAAQAQTFFKREDLPLDTRREIAQSLVGASTRECERKLAALAPEAAPPEKIRPVSETQTVIQFTANAELMGKPESSLHKSPRILCPRWTSSGY